MDIDEFDDLKIILWLILFLLFGIVIITCKHDAGDYIMTVTGPVESSQTGITLEHEHILVDFIGADSTGYFRWNREDVISKALPQINEIKNRGVKTFIECTPAFLGRDPLMLRKLSKQTGLNFVTNTGYYGARNNLYVPQDFHSSGPEAIAAFIWVHAQRASIESNIRAAKEGAWISLDNIRSRPDLEPGAPNTIDWYAERILTFKNEGMLHKLLISHDSGWYDPAKPGGGTFRGFTDIFDVLIPALKVKGLTDSDIIQIMENNPAKAFIIKIRTFDKNL